MFRCLSLGVAVFVVGCGDTVSRPDRHVTGTVTFDGKSVLTGSITFRPVDGKSAQSSGEIADGKFDLLVFPGKHRVEITAARPVPGGKDTGMGVPQETYIPARYNAKSELTAVVERGTGKSLTFDLKSD